MRKHVLMQRKRRRLFVGALSDFRKTTGKESRKTPFCLCSLNTNIPFEVSRSVYFDDADPIPFAIFTQLISSKVYRRFTNPVEDRPDIPIETQSVNRSIYLNYIYIYRDS